MNFWNDWIQKWTLIAAQLPKYFNECIDLIKGITIATTNAAAWFTMPRSFVWLIQLEAISSILGYLTLNTIKIKGSEVNKYSNEHPMPKETYMTHEAL